MKILLINPPMSQINTPFPGICYLTRFLRKKGFTVVQRDLGLDLFLKIFSREGLTAIGNLIKKKKVESSVSEQEDFFLEALPDYLAVIDPVVGFLQGNNSSLALRIAQRNLLPEGPRFLHLQEHPEILETFGDMGIQDKAKYLSSLMIDDLADLVKHSVDPRFELSKYGESLASSQTSLDPLLSSLGAAHSTLIDTWIDELVRLYQTEVGPNVVGYSLPFPGNVYDAMRASVSFKKINPSVIQIVGGGFVNTELRDLDDERWFDFFDFMIFDDGELALELLLKFILNKKNGPLVRTWYRDDQGEIKKSPESVAGRNIAFVELDGPTYEGLSMDRYVSMLEMPNPVHRMWSDFRWNKLILAHGCYWRKCNFCDVNLDYIKRFEPQKAAHIVDSMERLISETGHSGFHFVDEAAPPALLRQVSQEILKRRLIVSWWGNLRFDTQFNRELTDLMKEAGCVAVTGGVEVACERLLKLMNKGTHLDQIFEVTGNFRDSGIFVHAYLQYGFPTETVEETLQSLEVVRRLFEGGHLQSAHWHRFVATAHSPIGRDPKKFQIQLQDADGGTNLRRFARNAIPHLEVSAGGKRAQKLQDDLGQGLRKAVYNYMHGVGLDQDVDQWF